MRKHNKQQLCVYCSKSEATTADHVPPKGFFPDPLPSDLVTVPSCRSCNNSFGKDEEYARNFFAAGWSGDETSVGYKVFTTKVMRSATRGTRKMLHMIRNSISLSDMHSPAGMYLGKRPTIEIDRSRVDRVVAKICRGLYYLETGRPLPPVAVAHVILSPDDKVLTHGVGQQFSQLPTRGTHPEVFRYKYMTVEGDSPGSVWVMQFYEAVTFLVATYGVEELAKFGLNAPKV